MAYDLFVTFRIPTSVTIVDLPGTKEMLAPDSGQFNRCGWMLDEETGEHIAYYELLDAAARDRYIEELLPGMRKWLTKDEPIEQWVGPE